jgi:hypothetical protein
MSIMIKSNMILMKGILSLAPATSPFSSAVGGARGQFRQISAGMGGAASVASVPVDLSQIKREMSAYNSLKANGVQSAAKSAAKLSFIIPMKDKDEMKGLLRAFNKKRA